MYFVLTILSIYNEREVLDSKGTNKGKSKEVTWNIQDEEEDLDNFEGHLLIPGKA
jgi:hypothetical protein